jgi:glutaredoxin
MRNFIKGNIMLTIYSKNNCSYCVQAKDFLASRGVAFTEVKIDEDAEAKNFIISEGHRTVPQIYNGKTLFAPGGFMGLLSVTQEQFAALQAEKFSVLKEEFSV